MESPDEKELDERALPAEPSDNSSRPHRERHKPDSYSSLAPDGSISSKPKSLPHHSQAADPSPTMTGAAPAYYLEHPDPQPEEEEDTAAKEGKKKITHNYARPESAAEEQSAEQPAPPSEEGLRPDRSRGKRDYHYQGYSIQVNLLTCSPSRELQLKGATQ
ncbi:unnamed protein product [Arctogadus glacialis]